MLRCFPVDTAQTERIIGLIDLLVASKNASPGTQPIILDRFVGEIICEYSVSITRRRCDLADMRQKRTCRESDQALSGCMSELEWKEYALSDWEVVLSAIQLAIENGWEKGREFHEIVAKAQEEEAGECLDVLLTVEGFVEALWKNENLEKHRLGLSLVADPIAYVRIYV